MTDTKAWGQLTTFDLFNCPHERLTDAQLLHDFCIAVADAIDMVRYGEPKIQRFGDGDLEGYTAVQLIETSSIVVHLDETGNRAFIDVFSCKPFPAKKAKKVAEEFFRPDNIETKTSKRGVRKRLARIFG